MGSRLIIKAHLKQLVLNINVVNDGEKQGKSICFWLYKCYVKQLK